MSVKAVKELVIGGGRVALDLEIGCTDNSWRSLQTHLLVYVLFYYRWFFSDMRIMQF